MYGIFSYIYHKTKPNYVKHVGKYSSPMMDGMGLETSFSAILHPQRGFECYFLPDFKPAGILRVQPCCSTLVNPEKKKRTSQFYKRMCIKYPS